MNKKKRFFSKFFNILSTVLMIVAFVAVVAVFALRITGARPKLFGYYFFNVMSDSMSPMLEVGDVILVREVPASEIHEGDVITYHATKGELADKDITHKVIEEPVTDTGGTVRIRTKGIRPGAIEDPEITGEQVIGKYVKTLKVLGIIYTVFRQWYGLAIFLALLFIVIGKEMFNLLRLNQKVQKANEITEADVRAYLEQEKAKKQKEEKNQQSPKP